MDIDKQKIMALDGLWTWAAATLAQVDRMEAARAELNEIATVGSNRSWHEPRRSFSADRHLFLIAAYKLVEYSRWAAKADCLDTALLAEIEALAEDIKSLRNMNEHAVEYFLGGGRQRDEWKHVTAGAMADASSTIGSKIGNRLDWNDVAARARRLLERLPSP